MKQQQSLSTKDIHAEDKLICAGLLGLCIAAVFHFEKIDQLDRPSTVALYLFALAIPLLATSIMIFSTESQHEGLDCDPPFRIVVLLLGPLLALVGIDLIFWSFHISIGIIFTTASFIGLFLWALFRSHIRAARSKSAQPDVL